MFSKELLEQLLVPVEPFEAPEPVKVMEMRLLGFNGWFEWLVVVHNGTAAFSTVWSSCVEPTAEVINKHFRHLQTRSEWREVSAN